LVEDSDAHQTPLAWMQDKVAQLTRAGENRETPAKAGELAKIFVCFRVLQLAGGHAMKMLLKSVSASCVLSFPSIRLGHKAGRLL